LRRILLLLAAAALLAAMVATSSVPAAAQADLDGDGVGDDSSIFDEEDNDEEGIFDDDEDGDEIDNVDVEDAFIDGDDMRLSHLWVDAGYQGRSK
jgi:hypothetical protein